MTENLGRQLKISSQLNREELIITRKSCFYELNSQA